VYDARMADPEQVALLVDAVVELVRQEVPRIAAENRNWKLTVNGSASGDVRAVIEAYSELTRQFRPMKAAGTIRQA